MSYVFLFLLLFFFFKQKTAYDMRIGDWSSDVCSSDLEEQLVVGDLEQVGGGPQRVERSPHVGVDGGLGPVVAEAAHPGLPGLLGLDHDIREDRVLPRGLVEDGAAEGEVARLCHALLQDRDQRDLGDPVPYLLELDREVDAEEVTGLFQRDAVLRRHDRDQGQAVLLRGGPVRSEEHTSELQSLMR